MCIRDSPHSSEIKLITSDDVNYKVSVTIKTGNGDSYAILNGYDLSLIHIFYQRFFVLSPWPLFCIAICLYSFNISFLFISKPWEREVLSGIGRKDAGGHSGTAFVELRGPRTSVIDI